MSCGRRSVGLQKLSLNNMKPGSLYTTTRRALLCSRVMGLLPLSGLTTKTSVKLRYTLWSSYTVYYAFTVFGQVSMLITSVYYLYENGITLNNINHVVFYTVRLVTILVLAKIAKSWKALMKKIEDMENQLPDFRKNYDITITAATVLILTAAALEHTLFMGYGYAVVEACNSDNITERYFQMNIPWIFDYTEYTLWKGIISEIYVVQATFIWSYNDLLVIIISLYLTEYFVTHNEHLKKAIQQEHFVFVKFRTQYLKIVHLVRMINVRFGIIVATSVGVNLYWTSMQLYYTLHGHQKHYVVCKVKNTQSTKISFAVDHTTYFTYSFSFLVMRVLLVLVLASRVHTNALVPMYMLYDLPSSKFTIEIQRYISQIKNIKIAMSGLDFFYVTRSMIVTVLGTIVTYELVLLQLDN